MIRSFTSRIDKPSALALALIAIWILALATGLSNPNGWITTARGLPAQGDFLGIYAAGTLAASGEPASAYDPTIQYATLQTLTDNRQVGNFPWVYPPTFLPIAAVLALLPFCASMAVWTIGTLAAFAAVLSRVTTSRRDLLLMLATPAPWLNFYIGQNGALTGALMGSGLLLLAERPILAGLAFGLLSIKPHLGLLIPVALLAGRYYRAFFSAAVTTIAFALATLAAFGTVPWIAWPAQMSRVGPLVGMASETEKIQSLFGFARSLGIPSAGAMTLQAILTLSIAAVIAWLWRRRDVGLPLKCAALAAATTLASPYLFAYDLPVLTIAQAFFLRHLQLNEGTATKGEVYALVLANVLVLAFASFPPVPLAVCGSAIVLGVILRRVLIEQRRARKSLPQPKKCPAQPWRPHLAPARLETFHDLKHDYVDGSLRNCVMSR
ncbi:MAG: glycosyltransferase family 87 protein [Hyphomicrobium sp.]|uniref:glycosyltransferase family 87 protein n=1 Tax=Hyphomicrobium sp. TaxID=82 RepID=UPI0039E6D974